MWLSARCVTHQPLSFPCSRVFTHQTACNHEWRRLNVLPSATTTQGNRILSPGLSLVSIRSNIKTFKISLDPSCASTPQLTLHLLKSLYIWAKAQLLFMPWTDLCFHSLASGYLCMKFIPSRFILKIQKRRKAWELKRSQWRYWRCPGALAGLW